MEHARTIIESTLIPHTGFGTALERIKQCLAHSSQSSEPICLPVVGESRTGKSRLLEEAESLAPRHRTRDGAVIPIVRIRTPSRPTVKGVASLLLKALGDPKWETGTEIVKTARLEALLKECKTLMVMLDEFQHFFDKGRHKIFHEAADWLKTLVDETKVTLIVSGLETCLPILRQNEQLSGRFLAPAYLRRFHWEVQADRDEFLGVLSAFEESMSAHFEVPPLAGSEMAFRFWCASGGLIGLLAKLLRQTVWNACDSGRRTISLDDFAKSHQSAIAREAPKQPGPNVLPFDKSFNLGLTQENIASGLSVGVREPESQPEHRVRGRRTAANEPSLSQVLKARTR